MGKALLQGQWDEAIALVMSSRFVSHGAEAAAKQGFSQQWRTAQSLPLHQRRPRIRELVSAALRSHTHTRERERETERQTDRQTETETETERDRHTHTHTERDTHRQGSRQEQREQ